MSALEKFLRWRFTQAMRKKTEAERRQKKRDEQIFEYIRDRRSKDMHDATRRGGRK